MRPKLCIECGDMAYWRKDKTYSLCTNCLLDQILTVFETNEEVDKRLVKVKVGVLLPEKIRDEIVSDINDAISRVPK